MNIRWIKYPMNECTEMNEHLMKKISDEWMYRNEWMDLIMQIEWNKWMIGHK